MLVILYLVVLLRIMGRTGFMFIELLRFLIVHNFYRNHYAKFEIDRTILKCLNYQTELTVTEERTDRLNYRKA